MKKILTVLMLVGFMTGCASTETPTEEETREPTSANAKVKREGHRAKR